MDAGRDAWVTDVTLGRTLTTVDDLIGRGFVRAQDRRALKEVGARYAVAVTPSVAALIDGDVANDPIARQFIPSEAELVTHPAELADPIGDEARSPVKGVVHRYSDRALLKIVGVCPVYCRFCFRREMVGPGQGLNLSAAELDAAIAYFAATPAIREVIMTGGDPLILSPRRIRDISRRLAAIDHVETLRWHTRVPVVAPDTITDGLIDALTEYDKTTFIAVHANHAREFTPEARSAIARLRRAGIGLLSQSVLLRGVNDDPDTLEALMRTLVELQIKPYYLHHGDLAAGTGHFRVPLSRGQDLMSKLRERLPDDAMPAYVLDIPGGYGKVPIGPAHVAGSGPNYTVIDRFGARHAYADACTNADGEV